MGRRKDIDGLVNAPPQAVAETTFRVIDAVQVHPPMVRASGIAAAFLLTCERLKLDPQDVFVATKNILLDEREGGSKHFEAVRLFVENERLR